MPHGWSASGARGVLSRTRGRPKAAARSIGRSSTNQHRVANLVPVAASEAGACPAPNGPTSAAAASRHSASEAMSPRAREASTWEFIWRWSAACSCSVPESQALVRALWLGAAPSSRAAWRVRRAGLPCCASVAPVPRRPWSSPGTRWGRRRGSLRPWSASLGQGHVATGFDGALAMAGRSPGRDPTGFGRGDAGGERSGGPGGQWRLWALPRRSQPGTAWVSRVPGPPVTLALPLPRALRQAGAPSPQPGPSRAGRSGAGGTARPAASPRACWGKHAASDPRGRAYSMI